MAEQRIRECLAVIENLHPTSNADHADSILERIQRITFEEELYNKIYEIIVKGHMDSWRSYFFDKVDLEGYETNSFFYSYFYNRIVYNEYFK